MASMHTPLALLALMASSVYASEPMSSAELLGHCRTYLRAPESGASAACEAYVAGYLDGLRSDALLESRPPDRRESWSERAARTRLGRKQYHGARRPRYCVPKTTDVSEIIGQFVGMLEASSDAPDLPASHLLADTLRRHYSCTS